MLQQKTLVVKTVNGREHFTGYELNTDITDTGALIVVLESNVTKVYANGQWLTASYEKAE